MLRSIIVAISELVGCLLFSAKNLLVIASSSLIWLLSFRDKGDLLLTSSIIAPLIRLEAKAARSLPSASSKLW